MVEEDSDVEEPDLNSDLEFDADWGFKDVPLDSGTSFWVVGSHMETPYQLMIMHRLINHFRSIPMI